MYLIDDVDLVTAFRRRVRNLLNDATCMIHTVVGRTIHLHYVHGTAFCNGTTGRTLAARASVFLTILTVDCLGKKLCHRSFTGTSGTGKKISVTNTVVLQLILQCGYNMILSLYFREFLWSELSV